MRTPKGGLFKRGSIYWALWYAGGKRYRVSTGMSSKRDAEERLKELVAPFALQDDAERFRVIAAKAESLESQAIAALRADAPFVHVWGWFSNTKSKKLPRPATMEQYEFQWGIFRDWMTEHCPDVLTVEAMSLEQAQQFIQHLRDIRTANTANKYRNLLAMIWDVLRTDDRTHAENIWKRIALAEVEQHSRRELTIEELKEVCRSAPGDLRPLFAIGLYTGMRLGDCCTLKWSEVDLARNIIRRIPNKSMKRRKVVLIPIHPVLKVIFEEQPRDGEYVLPRIATDYLRHSSYVTDRVQKHFTDCGIKTTVARDKGVSAVEVGFHSLRHSFVSLSREAGAPLAVVEAIVGHSNPAMTRHYSHVGDDAALRAVALLPDVTQKSKTAKNELVLKLPASVLKTLDRAAKSHGKATHVQALELLIHAIKEMKQMKNTNNNAKAGSTPAAKGEMSNSRRMALLKRAANQTGTKKNVRAEELLGRATKQTPK